MGVSEVVRRLGGVASRRELVAAGVSQAELRWALRGGKVTSVRRGVYIVGGQQHADPQRRHALALLAEQKVNPGLVACSTSAAVVLGLPTPSGPPAEPVLTAARKRSNVSGRRSGRLTREALLPAGDVWSLRSGLRVTSPLRTVLDCAREWDRPWGLAIADAALRHGTVKPEELRAAAAERAGIPGGRRALWVAEHARRLAESPLESVVRALILLAGFPEPALQVWLNTRQGNARVDLLDERHRLVIEADGRVKYQHPDDLWAEKRREDAIRELGYAVIRFTMPDAADPADWLALYRASLQLRS